MDENRIIFDLLNMLGLEEKDGKVFDTDTMTFLIFNGGFLTVGPTTILHRRDVRFDPIHNMKLTEYLMNVLFTKEAQENGLYVYSFGLNDHVNPVTLLKTFQCVVITNNGEVKSDIYYNCNLAYIDCMYRITGTPNYDMHMADYKESELYERLKNKK